MKPDSTLQSWLEHPAKKMQELFKRSIERAEKSSRRVASVAVGRRRLEIRANGARWTLVDPKSGEPFPFVQRTRSAPRPKVHNGETPSQFKARMAREKGAEDRQKAAAERQIARRKLRGKATETRAERTARLAELRGKCRVDIKSARGTPKPGRRVAVAKARVGCAERAARTEETFSERLSGIERDLGKLTAEVRRKAPRREAPTLSKRERVAERDDFVRTELELSGNAALIPIWEREKSAPAYAGLSGDRAAEKFAEFLEENPDAFRTRQEAAEAFAPNELACAEAAHLAAVGDPGAAEWAATNCEEGRPRPRPKGSHHARNTTWLPGVVPPDPSAARTARSPREKKQDVRRPLKGQQTIGVSRSVLERPGGNRLIPF